MDNEFDYFVIESENGGDEIYPLIDIVEMDDEDNPSLMSIEIGEPFLKNPIMADCLEGSEWFFSKKIYDIINDLKIDYIKLIETKWIGKYKNIDEKYWCLSIENRIEAMDKEKSVYKKPQRTYKIQKFILDKTSLEKIPLEKRLIFVLQEEPASIVFHKSVTDLIMALNPTGLQFTPIEKKKF